VKSTDESPTFRLAAYVTAKASPTVMLAGAVFPVPPLPESTVTRLCCIPSSVPVTFTANVQVAPAAMLAPARLTVVDPGVAVMAPPPQDPVTPLGDATPKPDGKTSVKFTPVRVTTALGFAMVKLKLALPPTGIASAPKPLVIDGGRTTIMPALDVLPAPTKAAETVTALFCWPPAIPFTFTEIVQEAPCTSVPPVRLTVEDPAVAVTVPPQAPVNPFGVETTSPAGSVSVKLMPVSVDTAFGFMMVKLRLTFAFSGTVGAPKLFVIEGGPITSTLALDVFPVSTGVVTVTELFFNPMVSPVTFTEKVQVAPLARVAPARVTVDDPAVAVMVPPPQVLVNPLGVETTRPAGSVSVKAIPDSARALAAGFVMERVKDVLPDNRIGVVPNDLLILGGAIAAATPRLAITIPLPTVRAMKFDTGSEVVYRMLVT